MLPLVPSCVDLRGLPYLPLDVNRIRDSQLAISASGDEFRAAVLLWCASWNQVPAASLPDHDETLAAYAGYGRDTKGWRRVKVGAMRGFVMCDDGRWYHPVVAEKALEAWEERKDYRDKRDNEAERLKRHRDEHRALRNELRTYGVVAPWNEKVETLRELVQQQRLQRTRTEPETRTGALPATAKKGREGKGLQDTSEEQPASPGAAAPPLADPIFGTGLEFLVRKGIREASARSFLGLLRKELRDDLTVAELLVEAERQDVSNPQGWLTAAAKQRKRTNGGANGSSTSGRKQSAVEQVEAAIRERRARESDAATAGFAFGSGLDANG